MTIFEFAEVIGDSLVAKSYYGGGLPRRFTTFSVFFENSLVQDIEGVILYGIMGNGKTIDEATSDYVKKIKGKILVTNWKNGKKSLCNVVPKDLTL